MKSLSTITVALGLAALSFAGEASAAPGAFGSKCGALTINNDTPATLLRDTEDCSLVWVLPPNAGKTQLTGFTPSANLGMCKEVKTAQGASERVLQRMDATQKEVDELQPQYDAANKRVVDATAKVHDLLQKAELKQLNDMETAQAAVEDKLQAVSDKMDGCDKNCDALSDEYKQLSKQRQDLASAVGKLRSKYLASVRQYDQAKAELNAAEEERNDVGAGLQAIYAKQSQFHKDLLDLLVFYSRIEGGYAHLDYDTQWDDAVARLTKEYNGQYQFRKVPTKDARIFANLVGAGDQATYLSSMPSLLDYSINGLKFQPFGEERQPEMSSLPSHFSGTLRLSLMGGCPLYYKDYLTSNELQPSGTAPDSWNFAISTTYKYPAAYKMKMTASYNLYQFYQKIVESSSSGGLFSSHTATSIAETKLDHDTFSIDWTVEDPDSKYDEETRQQIAKELKLDLIGRVLGTMAQPTFENVPMPSVPQQQGHGAVVLANGLQSTCGMVNVWCTAGSWVLRGLDAIFGSNSATNTFRSTWDRTATETWNSDTTKWNTGATLFTNLKQ